MNLTLVTQVPQAKSTISQDWRDCLGKHCHRCHKVENRPCGSNNSYKLNNMSMIVITATTATSDTGSYLSHIEPKPKIKLGANEHNVNSVPIKERLCHLWQSWQPSRSKSVGRNLNHEYIRGYPLFLLQPMVKDGFQFLKSAPVANIKSSDLIGTSDTGDTGEREHFEKSFKKGLQS